jgi:1-acyl-sn-glycerol-3-phosphate acyltransferase
MPQRGSRDAMSQATFDRAMGSADTLGPPPEAWAPMPVPAPVPAPARSRVVDEATAARGLPRGDLSAFQRSARHLFSRILAKLIIRPWFRTEVVGAERLPDGPAVYCFNHLSWMDPALLMATFPKTPRMYFYGPKEQNLRKGRRNQFMWFTGICVPFSPLKDDLLTSVRWAQAVFDTGGVLAISGEGSIHVHEGDLLPFQEGVAYLALRAGVPIVPIAITGISWARFRSTVTVRIGEPIETSGRPTRQAIAHFTARTWHAIRAMVAGDRDLPVPGRLERWVTDLFNDWGPGGRTAATQRRGPDPADVPIPPLAPEAPGAAG